MSSGWNTVETPMCLNGFRSNIRIGSTYHTYIQTPPSPAICTSTQPEGDCCPTAKILHCLLHSENYWYVHFHSVWWWLLSCRKILHCLLHSDAFYWYVYFHSVWWWLVSYRKIIPPSPTFRHLLRICVLSLSLMVIDVLQEDPPLSPTFRRLSTAICTSTQPDGDCYSTFRHLLLLFVLPLSLMVISVLHSDTFYCYLYFH